MLLAEVILLGEGDLYRVSPDDRRVIREWTPVSWGEKSSDMWSPPRCQRSVATPSTAGGSHITARLRGSRVFILTNLRGQGDHPCYTGCIQQITVDTCSIHVFPEEASSPSFSSSIWLWTWGSSAWRPTAIFLFFHFYWTQALRSYQNLEKVWPEVN